MPYRIKMIDGGVIELRFSGASDVREHEKSRDDVADLCREKGLTRVLVDMSEQTSFEGGATMDLFGFGESFVKGKFPRSAAIAVVNPVSEEAADDVEFVVTVARNRGFSMELFRDTEEALKWLSH